jgi:hypothetical protein
MDQVKQEYVVKQEEQPAFPAHHASWNQYLVATDADAGVAPSFTCMDCGKVGMAQIVNKDGPTQGRPFYSCWEKEGGCGAFIGFIDKQVPSKEKRQKKRVAAPAATVPVQLPPPANLKKAKVALDAPVVQTKMVLQFLGDIRKDLNDPRKVQDVLAKIDGKVEELINLL